MTDPAPPPPGPDVDDSPFQRLLLDDLIEMGGIIMRDIHRRASAHRDRRLDFMDGFVRVSRAIRRSIMLAMRSATPPQSDDATRLAARKRLVQQIHTAIDGAPQRTEWENHLLREAEDTESIEPGDEMPDLPLPILLAEICRDLGLASKYLRGHAWKHRVPYDVRMLCARAAR